MTEAERTMKLHTFAAFSRYRPRFLTLVVLFLIAAPVALANFSNDMSFGHHFDHTSYGWPLIWHRYVDMDWGQGTETLGWYFSGPRLAGNLAIWLFMTAAPAGACEWLLRRYPPRLCWSLRTMLVAVGLISAFCAWFTAARNRANLQDLIIAQTSELYGNYRVRVERWGPKWLDLVGADRFRREIVSVELAATAGDDADEKLLQQLAGLPRLSYLTLSVDHLNPKLAQALSKLRQLRSLSIEESEDIKDDSAWQASLEIIGGMSHLEYLHLSESAIGGERLAHLASLTNLKSLSVDGQNDHRRELISRECLQAIGKISQLQHLALNSLKIRHEDLPCLAGLSDLRLLCFINVSPETPPLLAEMPALPRLETIDIWRSEVGNKDLRRLALLPRLRAIGLKDAPISADALKELALLESLEELGIDDKTTSKQSCVSSTGIELLLAFKHLKKLHLSRSTTLAYTRYVKCLLDNGDEVPVLEEDLEPFLRALKSLRQAKPAIVIDGQIRGIMEEWNNQRGFPFTYDGEPIRFYTGWLPAADLRWISQADRAKFEKQEGWANFYGAGRRADDGQVIAVEF